MKVIAVIGNRDIVNEEWVYKELATNVPLDSVVLVGGAKGAQELTEKWCKANDVTLLHFKPWNHINHRMPHMDSYFFWRNKQMIDESDQVLFLRSDTVDAEVNGALDYVSNSRFNKDVIVTEVRCS